VFGCIIVPFGYFWFEEEGAFGFEVPRTGTRVCGAAKYVAALLVLFGGLATMSLAVPYANFCFSVACKICCCQAFDICGVQTGTHDQLITGGRI
jgi:hypothetical protein